MSLLSAEWSVIGSYWMKGVGFQKAGFRRTVAVAVAVAAFLAGPGTVLGTTESRGVAPLSIPPSEGLDFWGDPSFVRQFIGSYGVRSDVEPEIGSKEQAILKKVRKHLPDDPELAAQKLSRSVGSDSNAALDFVLANLRLQLGRVTLARKLYERAVEKFPDFLRAHKNLGIALVRAGHYVSARDHLTRAIELGAGGGQVYGLLGFCHLNRDNLSSAESSYRQAAMMESDNLNWKMGLAKSLLGQQKHKEAKALLAELIDEDPGDPDYWLHQANAFIALDQPMEAAANYEMIRLVDELSADALANLARIYLRHDIRQRALEAYLQLIGQGKEKYSDVVLQAAELLGHQGNWEHAEKLIGRLKTEVSEKLSEEGRHRLKRLEARKAKAEDNWEKAVGLWQEILKKHPLDGEVLLQLADYHAKNGDYEKGELLYERAARLDDFRVRAWLRHSEMLVEQKQYKPAINLLKKAQRADPQKQVQEYLKQVKRLVEESG